MSSKREYSSSRNYRYRSAKVDLVGIEWQGLDASEFTPPLRRQLASLAARSTPQFQTFPF